MFTKLAWRYEKWERWSFSSQKNQEDDVFLVWNIMFTGYYKVLDLKLLEMKNTVFFEPKSWWDIYWSLKRSCFGLFRDGKNGLFLTKKLMERWYLLGPLELSVIFKDLRNRFLGAVYQISMYINSCSWFRDNLLLPHSNDINLCSLFGTSQFVHRRSLISYRPPFLKINTCPQIYCLLPY